MEDSVVYRSDEILLGRNCEDRSDSGVSSWLVCSAICSLVGTLLVIGCSYLFFSEDHHLIDFEDCSWNLWSSLLHGCIDIDVYSKCLEV